jgi:hypothetical protein
MLLYGRCNLYLLENKEFVELHHRAGLTSPVRQACRRSHMEETTSRGDVISMGLVLTASPSLAAV